MEKTFFISNFYVFHAFASEAELSAFESWLTGICSQPGDNRIDGLIISALEGLNGTIASEDEAKVAFFESKVMEKLGLTISFKRATSNVRPFLEFVIKRRPEIVTLHTPDLVPQGRHGHMSPEEWDKTLKGPKDYVLVDTRNWYETEIGTFRGALLPPIEQFTEFPEFAEKNIPKEQKVLMFCTGGIRCEKGLLELERRGFKNVHQLDGGILSYLEKFPNSEFEGECFVFDNRVAVKQDLSPTETYRFCPHCGQPAKELISCVRCGTEKRVCASCLSEEEIGATCSKNCAHHHRLNPTKKGRPQIRHFNSKVL